MKISQSTEFKIDLKSVISIIVVTSMFVGMYYTLQADIEEAKQLPPSEIKRMEYDLKQKGEYEEYERKKMLANAEAWLKQAEVEKEVLKTTLKASFVNEDGSIEEWAEGMSEDELVSKIDNDFEKFRTDFIGKLKNEQTTD